MRAVVLVGGFGTRLRPLTLDVPKQMLPVGQRPMIEQVVRWLAGHGVSEVILSLGYRPDAFLDRYPDDRCAGVHMVYAVEPEPLDTAGAIAFAADHADIDDTFVVVNGDVLTTLDLSALIDLHRTCGAEGTIALTRVDDPSRFGVVPTAADGRVEAFVEKPPPGEAPTHWINGGTYVCEPAMVGRIATNRPVSVEREVFPAMVTDGVLYAMQSPAYWVDAGTPATYLAANMDLLGNGLPDGDNAVAPDCDIHPTAVVEHSVVLPGVRVGEGAEVRDSVVMAGTTISPAARVEASLVGERAIIEAGAVVTGLSVVGNAVSVPAGVTFDGVRLPNGD